MKKFGILLSFALITLSAAVYYQKGTSKSFVTRSYFQEQRLRHLLFLETHEPVDYSAVAREYEQLLKNIRFGAKSDQRAIYEKALARTKITVQIISHVRQYNATRSIAELEKAQRFYKGVLAEGLNEYEFYLCYLDNQRIDEEWFRAEFEKSKID